MLQTNINLFSKVNTFQTGWKMLTFEVVILPDWWEKD